MTELLIPSVVPSLISVALWADYAIGAARAYRHRRTRAMLREYTVALMCLVAVAGLSIAIVFVLTNPHHSPLTAWAIGAVRFVLLSVGLWLAWDRRVHP